MASAYFKGIFYNTTPNACLVDIIPPTFAGIDSTTPNTDGSITVSWLPALDSTPPIEYVLYIALGSVSAAALFVTGNIVAISPELSSDFKIYTLSDQSTYLVNGQVYTLGVRAKDGVGNIDSNLTIQTETAIASGNMPAIYQTIANNLNQSVNTLNSISSTLAGSGGLTAEFEENEDLTALFEDIEELI